jgi:hypothetical protein
MRTILSSIKKNLLYAFVLTVTAISPALAGPAASAAADDTCTPPAATTPGVHWPTGSDDATFTYQCAGPYAGNWTNQYYEFVTATAQRLPLYDLEYSYDCTAQTWTMIKWLYSPAQGAYYQTRVNTATGPDVTIDCPAPAAATNQTSSSGESDASPTQTVSTTGPGSTNSSGSNTTIGSTVTNNTNLGMTNGVSSQATSGNVLVIGNTAGGSATSGDATSIANIANLLQSTSNVFDGAITFTADINGDVNGDFIFDPSALITGTGTDSTNSAANNLTINTDTPNNTDAQINNNIDVGATSGDATVANNTTAGDATSGNATAIVNLMNLINSVVASGKSFVGTININGNLNGDILLPQSFIDQLLASSGPSSTNTSTTTANANTTITNNTSSDIQNNITSSAQSGDATVAGNTTGGSATSGSAGTNVTILNLTGSNVIGSNDLLVFVNVLGHWVGMIVNAPAGSTAASLGGGITASGPNSTNTTNNSLTDNTTVTNNNTFGINNNVTASAQSGDATVRGNTTSGNATSGNAQTAVNILNMTGSNLSLSNWFGVLFINVFGDWNGSFGVNTSAGDPVPANTGDPTPPVVQQASAPPAPSTRQFASFVSHLSGSSSTDTDTSSLSNATLASVLGASTPQKTVIQKSGLPTPDNASHPSYLVPAIGITIAATMLIGERVVAWRSKSR